MKNLIQIITFLIYIIYLHLFSSSFYYYFQTIPYIYYILFNLCLYFENIFLPSSTNLSLNEKNFFK
jgi:hypothetical protein